MWVCTITVPSIGQVVRFGWFAMSTLPVEVTDTDHSALMLASCPSMPSVDVWPFQSAPLSRAGPSDRCRW